MCLVERQSTLDDLVPTWLCASWSYQELKTKVFVFCVCN